MAKAIEAQIASIDPVGMRIMLDDERAWREAPDRWPLMHDWTAGLALRVEANDPEKVWPHRLVEPKSGVAVGAVAFRADRPGRG